MKKIIFLLILLIVTGAFFWLALHFEIWPVKTDIQQTTKINQSLAEGNLLDFEKWAEQNDQKARQIREKKAKQKKVSLVAVGDMMLSRRVGQEMVEREDYHYPFLQVKNYLSQADIGFGNLESPILPGRPVSSGSFVFRADPEVAESLAWAGFDVLNLANNHILNHGADGLLKTFGYLQTNDLKYCGAANSNKSRLDQLAVIEKKGLKIGFLGYAYGPDYYAATEDASGMFLLKSELASQDIKKAKKKVDFLVVSMHAGREYEHTSSIQQQKFARAAVEAGADLVIGHHPHVIQEVEEYQGKYIFYSLGNFVFDQMWSIATRQGLAVHFIITKEGLQEVDYLPVMIENYAQPRLAEKKEKQEILSHLQLDKLD